MAGQTQPAAAHEPAPETLNLIAMALHALSDGAIRAVRLFIFPLIALGSGLALSWKIIPNNATELQLWGLGGYALFALGIVWLTTRK